MTQLNKDISPKNLSELSVGGASFVATGGGVWTTIAGNISVTEGADRATGLPSSVCSLTAPAGHDDVSCCVMTMPLGMVHLTWASAGSDPAAKAAMQASFKIITDIS